MPYTKEQLKNNEHYERVIEATRREQINTFVKDANDKGILNDKAKLMAYWKRFAGKNRLSAHVIKQVEEELTVDYKDHYLHPSYYKQNTNH